MSTNSAGHKVTHERVRMTKELIQSLIDRIEASDKKGKDGRDISFMIDKMIHKLKIEKGKLHE
jgi:hypothetical protein